jgi:protein-disulfide isomerase
MFIGHHTAINKHYSNRSGSSSMTRLQSIFFASFRFILGFFSTILFLGLMISINNPVSAGDQFSPEQEEEIESVIYDYLMANPEVLIKALDSLRHKEEVAGKLAAQENLTIASEAIYNDPFSPQSGNLDGDVTIVEFFDYRCGYCKRVLPAVQELISSDENIRIIFKEFPILGEDSVFASRAAIATWLNWPEKYLKFHIDMMSSRGNLSQVKVIELAATSGIDIEKLRSEMMSENVDEAISRTMQLAEYLNINGTPAFIIGNELVPGAIDIDAMRALIEKARNNNS